MSLTIHRSLLLAALLALAACRSPEKNPTHASAEHQVTCICGTPEAAMDGCAHPSCLSGEGNPDNHDCVCGPLSFEGGEKE